MVTRDGRNVTQLIQFLDSGVFCLAGIVEGGEEISTFTVNGSFLHDVYPSDYDLFMATEKRTGYINIYPEDDPKAEGVTTGVGCKTGTGIFDDQQRADKLALPTRIAMATFEYEV